MEHEHADMLHREEPAGGVGDTTVSQDLSLPPLMQCVCVCFQVVQIIIGVLCILFSVSAAYSPLLTLHAPFCLAVTVCSPPTHTHPLSVASQYCPSNKPNETLVSLFSPSLWSRALWLWRH